MQALSVSLAITLSPSCDSLLSSICLGHTQSGCKVLISECSK